MEIKIKTSQRNQIIDITSKLEKIVKENSNNNKLCHIFTPHTTCAILIQENYDHDVKEDILSYLSHIKKEGWKHIEGNSDSHIKSMIIGPSKLVPIENNNLKIGRWQGILFCEFDGPRKRTIKITLI